jgi:tRNA 2-selenouridine synthase
VSLVQVSAAQAVPELGGFDAIIDARSPAEFAEDHLPGAVNWPVLDDAQRRAVGTLYVQVSPHEARKVGAAMVSRNIAMHLEQHARDLPREWRPLVYCWRGGQRSGSLALVLGQIGFRTSQLQGGYKGFRAIVRDELATAPAAFRWRVLCGRTGSGKTRLLQAIAAAGGQVLDLEGLAHHRGSILGAMPGLPQPAQKHFDTRVWLALKAFDPARPVFVESESARIGALRVPEVLIAQMHEQGHCLRIEMDDAARIDLLLHDYADLTTDADRFARQLEPLIELRGRAPVAAWQAMAREGRWRDVIGSLMAEHYDPLYERSMRHSYPGIDQAPRVPLGDGCAAALAEVAARLLAPDPGA